jgi:hypothetical protein
VPIVPTEAARRAAVVAEALSWRGSKFAHGQCCKGVAVDCSTFIAACYRSIGLFQADIPTLAADWFIHTTKEFYLTELQKFATEFTLASRTPQPGDIIIVKDVAIGAKVFSHGAIVVHWGPVPEVIHCFPPCAMTSNPLRFPAFVGKALKFFNPFMVPVPAAVAAPVPVTPIPAAPALTPTAPVAVATAAPTPVASIPLAGVKQ